MERGGKHLFLSKLFICNIEFEEEQLKVIDLEAGTCAYQLEGNSLFMYNQDNILFLYIVKNFEDLSVLYI